ncbi:hypothetical protein P7C71_g4819, partial [Lecanoromycetidae sp. Uapishka_2]
MSPTSSREYDLVVLGATGYTGKLCAEYITSSLPTNLKWAVAGRSRTKLLAIVDELKVSNSDRTQPAIEVATLSPQDLEKLARKTRVLINTIGPYYLYSTPVVETCANNGTHYLDVTGEAPWVLEMIKKYHETAKANHAIIIPEIGIESAPSDILAFVLTQLIRKELSVGTKEVVASVHELKGTPSGGTLATVFGIVDHYGLKKTAESSSGKWVSSPVPRPRRDPSPSFINRLLGVRTVPNLGTMTSSPSAGPNVATVQRSWGLLDGGQLYGPNFTYHEYLGVRNAAVGILLHFVFAIGALAIALPPLRWVAKKLVYSPGQGATKEASSKEALEYRAIATADQDRPNPRRAFARFRWDGPLYFFTGVCLAEAAMVLLKEDDLVERLDGGLLTPAMLGQAFVDRMKAAGMILDVKMIPDN